MAERFTDFVRERWDDEVDFLRVLGLALTAGGVRRSISFLRGEVPSEEGATATIHNTQPHPYVEHEAEPDYAIAA